MRTIVGLVFVSTSTLSVALSGCGSDDCADTASCGDYTGGTGTGGTGGAAGAGAGTGATGGDGSSCDMSKGPNEEACLVSNDHGIFVSPTGSDSSGDGTQSKPYKTLGKAVTEASTASKHVFACDDGNGYNEAQTLSLDASFDGLGIFGGFDCTTWSYSTTKKSKLVGAATAVRIESIPGSVRIEDFDITASNASTAGESSFVVVASAASGVTIRRAKLTAGNGANGAPGMNGTKGANGTQANTVTGCAPTPGQAGCPAECGLAAPPPPQFHAGGGWAASSACGSTGGLGGTATQAGPGSAGAFGTPQENVSPKNVNNAGAAGTGSGDGIAGTQGSLGDSGTVPLAAQTTGTFVSTGFTPADGQDGTDGFPGQGGGGGGASASASSTCIGASGGAGGMGGCGGTKGTAGGGGGASVALLSFQSNVTLDMVELVAMKAGDGGKGGDAGEGGSGVNGGNGGASAGTMGAGGNGGKGGTGGAGASGSGGTGGASYALVWTGTKPTKVGTVTLTPGSIGIKGAGGTVSGVPGLNPAPDGTDGVSDEEFEQL